ncbi:MAG: DUF1638 domain-containing protein [Spirochaetota bacterium]
MKYAVVGCSIFKNEIDFLRPQITSEIDFYWLPQRLHNNPVQLRRLLQEEIDKIDRSRKNYRAVLLLYGLCSKGTIGVFSRKYPMVISRVQDCIGLLLGSREHYNRHFRKKPGTYWFTRGWIETGFQPGRKTKYEGVFDPYKEKYRQYRKKFSKETSDYLINQWDQRWIKNYTTVAFIDWGMKSMERFKLLARESAENLGLEFENLQGSPQLMLNLLNGRWDQRNYLIVQQGQKIMPSYEEDILRVGASIQKDVKGGDYPEPSEKDDFSEKRRGMGLGIDAGGTYTDTVIYDFDKQKVVCWSKALTTHDNYSAGIENSLDRLLEQATTEQVSQIGLVSLSTTLATNAIVENKGGKVGLILIGYEQYNVQKTGLEPKVVIKGKHSITGELLEPLDEQEAAGAVQWLLSLGVDAFAVSSEVGVRNPEFELRVKHIINQMCGLPVVCGSELTRELNCVKRANTCYFNARLIPLVWGLLASVKQVLNARGVQAPLMVVKGDGSLMSEEAATTNPVEMIISGPAASVIGGAYLSGVEDGYVVDMGGTTTDVAHVKDGLVSYKEEGISIKEFRTSVKTVNVHTFGLGGDSYITYDSRKQKIEVGPQRVIPISYLAFVRPRVLAVLNRETSRRTGGDSLVQPADFFVFQKDTRGENLHQQENEIIRLLKQKGPMSRNELSQKAGALHPSLLRTERLERFGNMLRSGLTPTDLLHASGRVSFWNSKAASVCLGLYARKAGCQENVFLDRAMDQFYRRLLFHLFDFWFNEDGRFKDGTSFSRELASHLFFSTGDVQLTSRVKKPVVFIGAPGKEYAEGLNRYIDAQIEVPPFSGVANAVGAITGAVREKVTILIRPHPEKGYVAYTPGEKKFYPTLQQAKQEMTELAKKTASEKAKRAGARELDVEVAVDDKQVKISEADIIYLETVIAASVASVPAMKQT